MIGCVRAQETLRERKKRSGVLKHFLKCLISAISLYLHSFWDLLCQKTCEVAYLLHLTTIAGPWYFGRVLVPQRLINLSLYYHKILILQKFNDLGGKVLKQSIFSLY